MTALLVLALLASDPAPPTWNVQAIEVGEPAPGAGCWADSKSCLGMARALRSAEAERDELRRKPDGVPAWGLLLSLAAGALGGIVIGAALAHRK